jgi:hypothetical protein
MKSALILFLMSQPHSDFDRRLVLATATVESEFRVSVLGDSGRSWGLFQFGKARWAESGGLSSEWGRAAHQTQTTAMLRAINNYKKTMPAGLTTRQQIIWCTNCHNIGHGSLAQTAHALKVVRAFSRLPQVLRAETPVPPPARTSQARAANRAPTRLTPPAR